MKKSFIEKFNPPLSRVLLGRYIKGEMKAIDEGDLSAEQVHKISQRLDVPEEDVVNMNRRLAGGGHTARAIRAAADRPGEPSGRRHPLVHDT